MIRWPIKLLGELCDVEGGNAAPQGDEHYKAGTIPFVRMKDLGRPHFTNNLTETDDRLTEASATANRMKIFEPGCILFPRSGSVALNHRAILGVRACIVSHIGVLQNLRPELTPGYLYLYLTTFDMKALSKKTTGVDSIAFSDVKRIPVPVPPLPEQGRIVKLMDKADEVRKLRAQADNRTSELVPALFREMFGDPVTNPKGWPVYNFGELLAEPLRNGLSPAKNGTHPAKVFMLSAITGERFNATAWKDASFARPPDKDCQTSERLFLICRGNGNRGLVGQGKFPWGVGENFVFPDTMIAGVPKADILLPSFLEEAWNLPVTRSQIASAARTTNGTFKINQTAIEKIRLLVPPLSLQNEFAKRAIEIREFESAQSASRQRLESLFQSMLHRAFNGEL